MDDPHAIFVVDDDQLEEPACAVGPNDESADFAVIFLFDDTEGRVSGVEDVLVVDPVLTGRPPNLHT